MPPTANPYIVAFYVAGAFVMVPVLKLIWNAATFFVKAISTLDQIPGLADDVKNLRHARNNEHFSVEMSLTVIENDINTIQEKVGLPKRAFQDRRVSGLTDRRAADVA